MRQICIHIPDYIPYYASIFQARRGRDYPPSLLPPLLPTITRHERVHSILTPCPALPLCHSTRIISSHIIEKSHAHHRIGQPIPRPSITTLHTLAQPSPPNYSTLVLRFLTQPGHSKRSRNDTHPPALPLEQRLLQPQTALLPLPPHRLRRETPQQPYQAIHALPRPPHFEGDGVRAALPLSGLVYCRSGKAEGPAAQNAPPRLPPLRSPSPRRVGLVLRERGVQRARWGWVGGKLRRRGERGHGLGCGRSAGGGEGAGHS